MTVLCPICGREPVRSVTSVGNHVLRCDGDPKDTVPRHTVYVIAPNEDEAVSIWTNKHTDR